MNEAFRLSRIRAPRSTATALVLLTLVFILFGVVVSSVSPEHTAAAPRYLDTTAVTYVNWLIGRWGA